jgi:Ran GTPase-activating protein (RanGAP) involved in mRNA processing and transport
MAVSEDILAITFSERHAPNLNIDGMLMDSATIAGVLGEAKNRPGVKEITLRNVQVDEIVARGIEDLFQNGKKVWNKTETIHCSGLLSRMIQASLPWTEHFGFTGSVPIAHNPRYGLDEASLLALGKALAETPDNSFANTSTGALSPSRLTTLSLKGTRLSTEGFGQFCEGLAQSTSLKTFQMSHCALENEDVALLASALRENLHLTSLSLAHCKVGSAIPQPTPSNSSASDASVSDSTTQSTNNTNPQTQFSVLLEALVYHPTLEMLNISGMYCSEQSVRALGNLLREPQSRLWHLALKNNLSHPEGKLNTEPILEALVANKQLKYLQLAGNNANNDDADSIGRILEESNSTLRALLLTNNLIGDVGLLALARRLPRIRSLRYLDLQRNQFTEKSKKPIVAALEDNTELERLDLDGTWNQEKSWWLSLNRGGRRLLQSSERVHSSLWPVILERAYRIHFGRNQPTANLDVAYFMIRRVPTLFESASSVGGVAVESTQQKRPIGAISTSDNAEEIQRTPGKRMFSSR